MAHIGFKKLTEELAAKPKVHDAAALAAYIGRKKYTPAGFAALSVAGRKKRKAADMIKAAKK